MYLIQPDFQSKFEFVQIFTAMVLDFKIWFRWEQIFSFRQSLKCAILERFLDFQQEFWILYLTD